MTAQNSDSATKSTQSTGLLAESLIRRVWLRMTEIYGHKWTSAFGDDAMVGAGETWAKALRDLTGSQLAVGIEDCAVSVDPWPPTLPQFRAMCLGIPDLPTVIREMRAKGSHRSQFTALVWSYIDSYRYRQSTTEQADRQARDAYDAARDHVMRGGALPEPAAGEIEHVTEPRKPCDDGVARDALAKAAASLGMADEE